MHFLELKDLSKYYHSGDVITMGLRKVSMGFDIGEFVAVTGESGSGKSTLMNVVSGMDTFEEGEMFFMGEETSCFTDNEWIRYRKDNISFIFQDYNLIDSYTVLQNVEIALLEKFPDKKDRRKRALELLEKVELLSHKKHKCTKLSGGQKQRVAIARALAKDAPIMSADEPTGNLDEATGKAIIELLSELSKDKLLIMVTHNFEDVQDYATRKIRLYDGSVAEDRVIRERELKSCLEEKSSGNQEKEDKLKVFRQKFKNLLTVSFNNIFSTPKKSIFIFSTVMVSAAILLMYFLLAFNSILLPSEYRNGERKDTALIFRGDRADFTEEERTKILGIDGVETAMLNYNALGNVSLIAKEALYGEDYGFFGSEFLNVASLDKEIEYGKKPVADNEILVAIYDYEPNLDYIGKTVTFSYEIFGESQSVEIIREFKITGFVNGYYNYLTSGAIESISKEVARESLENAIYSLNLEIYEHDFFINDSFATDYVRTSSSIPQGTIALVYNTAESYNGDDTFYNTYDFIINDLEGLELKNPLTAQFVREVQYGNSSFVYKIISSTENENSEIYNELYQGDILIVFNPMDFYYFPENAEDTNSAKIIFDQDYNINMTIKRLKDAGYKVVYKYGSASDAVTKLGTIGMFVQAIIIGLFMVVLGLLLITEILHKVMRSKNKDYNIFRTLGFSNGTLKLINYIEFIVINTIAYLFAAVLIAVLYTVAKMSGNYRLFLTFHELMPYGVFHYMNIITFFVAYFILIIQSFLILRRHNKKILKHSIKKALTDNYGG